MTDLRALEGGRAARPGPADPGVEQMLEGALVSGILRDPAQLGVALEIVEATDFASPRLAAVYAALQRVDAISLPTLADELDRSGELERVGGLAALSELADDGASGALVPAHAKRVRRHALEREERRLAERAANGDPDRRRMAEIAEKLDALEAGGLGLAEIGMSGARLQQIRERVQTDSPLPGLFDREPGVHLLTGRPKVAKTRFGFSLALPWMKGTRPWPGARALPGTPVFILSAEQNAARVERTLRELDTLSERPDRAAWMARISVIARDRDATPAARRMLTLDHEGRALLRAALLRDADRGRRYGLGIIDSLSRVLAPGLDENSAQDMTAFLQPLQELAEELGLYLILIHHRGHSADPGRAEAVGAGRGSSAISAVAPVSWTLDLVTGEPRQRVLKVAGNDVLHAEHVFEVAGEKAEPGAVQHFRLIDPLGSLAARIDDLIGIGEELSQSALAWRVAGEEPSNPKDRPPGRAQQIAKALRMRWKAEGAVEIYANGNATMIRRKS